MEHGLFLARGRADRRREFASGDPFNQRGVTVMERCSAQQTWSEQVLMAAKTAANVTLLQSH